MPNLIVHVHPFEIYKLYNGLRLHFTQKNYFYAPGKGTFNYSTFETMKFKYVFDTLSRQYTLPELEKIFISNMLDNPGKFIQTYSNKASRDIMIKWEKRLNDIDKIFISELKRYNTKNNFTSIRDIFDKLSDIQVIGVETVKINSVDEMLNDDVLGSIKTTSNGNLDYILQLREYQPEFIVVLDDLFLRKYHKGFLLNYIENIDQKSELFIKLYKYKAFVDFSNHFSNKGSILYKLLQNP